MSNKYRVVVDGTAYTVEVESLGAGAAIPAPVAAPAAPAAPVAPANREQALIRGGKGQCL